MAIKVIVADGGKARFLSANTLRRPLQQTAEMVHEAGRRRDQQLTSDAPGSGKVPGGAGRHAVVERNNAHQHEADKFSREVAVVIDKQCRDKSTDALYLLAAPPFLGLLRKHLSKQTLALVQLEIAKDLTHHSIAEIQQCLIKEKP